MKFDNQGLSDEPVQIMSIIILENKIEERLKEINVAKVWRNIWIYYR